jgi:hypothetical protein
MTPPLCKRIVATYGKGESTMEFSGTNPIVFGIVFGLVFALAWTLVRRIMRDGPPR